jgi:hypothetical protein
MAESISLFSNLRAVNAPVDGVALPNPPCVVLKVNVVDDKLPEITQYVVPTT